METLQSLRFTIWSVVVFTTLCLRLSLVLAESEEDLIKAIEIQASQLPLETFQFDSIYVQKVNPAEKISQYRPPPSEEFIFTHVGDDTGREVVVLRGSEDRLTVQKFKRVYIVLRRQKGDNYFVTTALIRDASPLDTDHPKVKVNGVDRLIEWETFSDHLTPTRNQMLLNALFCVSSFLSPCSFNGSVVSPNAPKSPRYVLKNVPLEAEKVKMITTDGSDGNDNYDLYVDLFSSAPPPPVKHQGRFFGDSIDAGGIIGYPIGAAGGLVGGVLGAATGIVCGVLGAVFGGCGGGVFDPGFSGYTGAIPPPGGFLTNGGLLGGVLGRKKRQDGEPSMDYSGWKTQYKSPSVGYTLARENEIFYGFGNCPAPVNPVDPKELQRATTNDQIIDFYLKILRADCLPDRRAVFVRLLADGLLIIKGKTLNLKPDTPKLGQHKLNLKDTLELASVAELRAFSQIYNEEVQNPNPLSKSPDGQKDISRSINFVTKIILRFLKESRLWMRMHMIRLTRYLVTLLKSIFSKVQQDEQILANCPQCVKDKEVNYNDRVQVIGLLEFIKYGLVPVDLGQDPQKVFTQFYAKNLNALGELVKFY